MEQQLTYPLDEISKRIIREEIKNNISQFVFDSVWNDFMHFTTIFESSDGYDTFVSSGAVASVGPNGIVLSTSTTSSNLAQIYRYPDPTFGTAVLTPFLSWKQPSRFRANMEVSSITNQTGYIVAGLDPTAASLPFYGFKIVNNTLYGVTRKDSGGGESTVSLATIAVNTNYVIEARHYPDIHKVEFYMESSGKMQLMGTLTTDTTIPDLTNTNHNGLLFYSIQTAENADKQLTSSYFEYIQRRDRF